MGTEDPGMAGVTEPWTRGPDARAQGSLAAASNQYGLVRSGSSLGPGRRSDGADLRE